MGALLWTARSAVPTVEGQNVWPIPGNVDEPCPHWIHPNIGGLFLKTLIVPETMIKEVTLPQDSVPGRLIFFPSANDLSHLFFRRKSDERMEMIRHQQEKMHKPAVFVEEQRGIEKRGSNRFMRELIAMALLAANGDEPNGAVWKPEGRSMGQRLTVAFQR